MTAGEIVLVVYSLATVGLVLVAIAFAMRLSESTREPALSTSLDCLDGKHAGCDACAGCSCHPAVFA